jgi:hypothetical protein
MCSVQNLCIFFYLRNENFVKNVATFAACKIFRLSHLKIQAKIGEMTELHSFVYAFFFSFFISCIAGDIPFYCQSNAYVAIMKSRRRFPSGNLSCELWSSVPWEYLRLFIFRSILVSGQVCWQHCFMNRILNKRISIFNERSEPRVPPFCVISILIDFRVWEF